jgi:hypothetical protein
MMDNEQTQPADVGRLDRPVGRRPVLGQDGVGELLRLCDEHDAVYGHGILLTTTIRKRLREQWRAMLYAPRDGTKVELLIEHRTWWTAHKCSPDEARIWRATWAGMSGTPIGWRPLKTPNVGNEGTPR